MHNAVNQPSLDVAYAESSLAPKALALALELGLTLNPLYPASCADFSLVYHPGYLGLTDRTNHSLFFIDFLSKSWRYRVAHATLKKELIARAMGAAPKTNPRILDLTAGLGRDSFILATLGFQITLLERSPAVFALLRDALQRAAQNPAYQPITARMQLIHTDAVHYLPNHTADIIYLDPMFPTRTKSALVKKELVLLQSLLGHDLDSNTVINLAISCAAKRVVVKRPRLSEPLGEIPPQFSYEGSSSRFDIYLTSR